MNYLIINTAVKIEILLQTDKTFYHRQRSEGRGQAQLAHDRARQAGNGFNTRYYSTAEKTVASAQLLPRVESMLKEAQICIEDIDVFGCVIGPGSFTGIRIGVSTVRALCYALNKPAVPVTYFDILSYNITTPLTTLIDGGNGVCYLKNYKENGQSDAPVCIRNEDITHYACCANFAADSRFTPILADARTPEDGQAALKAAFESVLKKDGAAHYSQLIPLYLRRSQPEREAGEV